MRKPRVCLISHSYLQPSYGAKLPYLAEGVDLRLISPNRFQFPYGLFLADFPKEKNYDVFVYPCRFPLVRTSTRWILESSDLGFHSFQPDIIHIENEVHSFIVIQSLIYSSLFSPNAKILLFFSANQRHKSLKGRALNFVGRIMQNWIDYYIASNTEGKNLFMENGVPSDRIDVSTLVGIDTNYFKPISELEKTILRANLGIGAEEFVIGFAGRFTEEKGIIDLIEAFNELKRIAKKDKLRLICVGSGPLKARLNAIPDIMIGTAIGGYKMASFYQIMDVLVLPSRTTPNWKEQFGNTLTEAMACGVSVIGSDSGEIPNTIGNAGFLFPEGDISSLVGILYALYSCQEIRKKYGLLGRRRVLENYSAKKIAEKTLKTYEKLINLDRRSCC